MTEAQKLFKAEKAGGNYGSGTKEMQARNYEKRKQSEAKRESLFESALQKFNARDIEGVGLVYAADPIPPSCRLDVLPVHFPLPASCMAGKRLLPRRQQAGGKLIPLVGCGPAHEAARGAALAGDTAPKHTCLRAPVV